MLVTCRYNPDFALSLGFPLFYNKKEKLLKKDKICPFDLYKAAISVLEEKSGNTKAVEWVSKLELLTIYMLKDRFTPSKRKIKTQKKEMEAMSTDLLRYVGIKTKTKVEAIMPLDMIKLFKALENTFIDGKINIDIKDLSLGQFKDTA